MARLRQSFFFAPRLRLPAPRPGLVAEVFHRNLRLSLQGHDFSHAPPGWGGKTSREGPKPRPCAAVNARPLAGTEEQRRVGNSLGGTGGSAYLCITKQHGKTAKRRTVGQSHFPRLPWRDPRVRPRPFPERTSHNVYYRKQGQCYPGRREGARPHKAGTTCIHTRRATHPRRHPAEDGSGRHALRKAAA